MSIIKIHANKKDCEAFNIYDTRNKRNNNLELIKCDTTLNESLTQIKELNYSIRYPINKNELFRIKIKNYVYNMYAII